MTTMYSTLPTELLLRIFFYFELQDLIRSRAICTEWRTLVLAANKLPARQSMFNLYFELVASPWFLKTRSWLLANLKPQFNRQLHINRLLTQYPSLPEDFRLWVLEWPARAVIANIWPGLPRKDYSGEYADDIQVLPGTMWMSFPQVSAFIYSDAQNRTAEYIPGIYVRRGTWLLLDERKSLRGKVFQAAKNYERDYLDVSHLEQFEHPSPSGRNINLHPDWIAYLKDVWKEVVRTAEAWALEAVGTWEKVEDIPFNDSMEYTAAAHSMRQLAWLRRNLPEHQPQLERAAEGRYY